MKKLLIIIFILLFPMISFGATTYTVTQDGGGADYSLAGFNALWGDYSGDTFYFSGTITGEITLSIYGTNGSPVILDGYQANDTTYKNLSEVSGRALIDRTITDNYGINLNGQNYVTVQDFEITDVSQAIYVDGNNFVLKRSYIYECNNGVILINANDPTIGGASGHGNVLKNIGNSTSHEDIALTGTVDGITISYNHLYADDDTNWGIDGIVTVGSVTDMLIEYNSIHGHNHTTAQGENAIDLKKTVARVVIRFNEIYDYDYESGIILNGNNSTGESADYIYIYGNSIHDFQIISIFFPMKFTTPLARLFLFRRVVLAKPQRSMFLTIPFLRLAPLRAISTMWQFIIGAGICKLKTTLS
jgi:hypothetical protein